MHMKSIQQFFFCSCFDFDGGNSHSCDGANEKTKDMPTEAVERWTLHDCHRFMNRHGWAAYIPFNQHTSLWCLLIGVWTISFHDLSCRFAFFFHSLPSRILPPNNLRSCRKCAEYHALLPKEQQRQPGVYRCIGMQHGTSRAGGEVEVDSCEIRLLIVILFS